MGSSYDVCFAGQLLEGQDLQVVRQNLAKLFQTSPETLDKLFSGKTQVIKKGCDRETAMKYKEAMARSGAMAIVRSSTAQLDQPESATAADNSADEAGFDLAPAGTDVLRPEERAVLHTSTIDTSALDLAETGATLDQTSTATTGAPDTSHLSMGEVGEDIPTLANTDIPLQPNIDHIDLAPQGTDFSDCAGDPIDSPELDLSEIEMAPPGSDVLEQQYKKKPEDNAPDTNHLRLED